MASSLAAVVVAVLLRPVFRAVDAACKAIENADPDVLIAPPAEALLFPVAMAIDTHNMAVIVRQATRAMEGKAP
jgi:hypothetical protein